MLAALAFPPADLGPLSLVALVPLLWTWRDARPAEAALYGWGFGVTFVVIVMWGLHYLGWVALLPLAVAAACYWAATGALVAVFARRGVRTPLLTAAIWTLFEGLRVRWPLGGLAWGEMGSALHDVSPARALASVGGVALVSFVVVACNGFVLDGIVAIVDRRWRPLAIAAGALVVLLLLTGLSVLTRFEPTVTAALRVGTVQPFDLVDAPPNDAAVEQYATDRTFALTDRLRGDYDLIVLPESSLNRDPEVDPALRQRLVDLGREHDAVVLANARHVEADGKLYNANLAYDPDGELQGVYAKQHLVPYGEYVPLRDELSFVGELRQIPYDFASGSTRTMFRAGGRPFASVICYESAYSGLVRDFVRDGAEAIVVSTSDRSYRRSGIAAQHLAMGQMRAAETARPLFQAAISGVTAVVDDEGRVLDESELFDPTTMSATIETTTGDTPFVRFGDWLLLLCGLGVIGAAVVAVWRPRPVATVDSGRAPDPHEPGD